MSSTNEIAEIHWLMDMLQTVDVGLIVLDAEHRIQVWNSFMANHSGITPNGARDQDLFELFPEIDREWLLRKMETVLTLKTRAFVSWEQRPYLIRFKSYRPITGAADFMYQKITLMPLLSSDGSVSHVCILVYDVTDVAVGQLALRQANAQLEELSRVDGLTQLYNRRAWQEMFESEFKRIRRTGEPASVVMFDIDHFKQVNDTWGHPAGDEVIRTVSRLLRQSKRETDIAGRYGGEEFAVVLVGTDGENARHFTERLRKKVEQQVVTWDGQEIRFTISLGIADFDREASQAGQWLEQADQALYYAKEHGRNQTALFGA